MSGAREPPPGFKHDAADLIVRCCASLGHNEASHRLSNAWHGREGLLGGSTNSWEHHSHVDGSLASTCEGKSWTKGKPTGGVHMRAVLAWP